jgi:creatinine amidohydrolase
MVDTHDQHKRFCIRLLCELAHHRRYLTTVGMSAYTDSGVIGYPSRASAEKSRAVIDHLGKAAGALITLLVEPRA